MAVAVAVAVAAVAVPVAVAVSVPLAMAVAVVFLGPIGLPRFGYPHTIAAATPAAAAGPAWQVLFFPSSAAGPLQPPSAPRSSQAARN